MKPEESTKKPALLMLIPFETSALILDLESREIRFTQFNLIKKREVIVMTDDEHKRHLMIQLKFDKFA